MAKKLASTKAAKKSTKKTATQESASIEKSAKKELTGKSASVESPDKSDAFEETSAKHNASVKAIADWLRALVRDVLPEADEHTYGADIVGIALYSIGGASNVICGIQIQEDGCLLYIHNAIGLTHPDLILEGRGGPTRHVKFASLDEIKTEPVKWLINEGKRLAQK